MQTSSTEPPQHSIYRLSFSLRLFERAGAVFIASTWNLSLYYLMWMVFDARCPVHAHFARLLECSETFKQAVVFRVVFAIITTAVCTVASLHVVKWSKAPEKKTAAAAAATSDNNPLKEDDGEEENEFDPSQPLVKSAAATQESPRAVRVFWRLVALALALVPGYVWGSLASLLSGTTTRGALLTAAGLTAFIATMTTIASQLLAAPAQISTKLQPVFVFISADVEVTLAALSLCVSKAWANLLLIFLDNTYEKNAGIVAHFLMATSVTIFAAVLLTKVITLRGSSGSRVRRAMEYLCEDVLAVLVGLVWNNAFMNALLRMFPSRKSLSVGILVAYSVCMSLFAIYLCWWFRYYATTVNNGSTTGLRRRTTHLLSVALGSVVGTAYGNTAEAIFHRVPSLAFGLTAYMMYSFIVTMLVVAAFWSLSKFIYIRRRQLGGL